MSESSSIPAGFCQCGCGERTTVVPSANPKWGYKKGDYRRYRRGHQPNPNNHPFDSWYEVDEQTGCWNWKGHTLRGYGHSTRPGYGSTLAHRISYQRRYGKLGMSTHVHHMCENTLCVNPDHLRAVTPAEHTRQYSRKTKLDVDKAKEIRHLSVEGWSLKSLAERFGVSVATIKKVRSGAYWLNAAPVECPPSNVKLTQDKAREIRRLATSGHDRAEIARQFSVAYTTVSGIVNGKTWKE